MKLALRHPARALLKEVLSARPNAEQILEARDQLEQMPHATLRNKAEFVLAGAIGAIEGLAKDSAKHATPRRSASETRATSKLEKVQREANSYLALLGVRRPPNEAQIDKKVTTVVNKARANKARIQAGRAKQTFPSIRDVARWTESLLGVHRGSDQVTTGIAMVRKAELDGRDSAFSVNVFDRQGYQVLSAKGSRDMERPGAISIGAIQASHGRNCDSLSLYAEGESSGRGNPRLVAEAFEALVVGAVEAGCHTITCIPGSPGVARLYEKMGFVLEGTGSFSSRPAMWALENVPFVKRVDNARRFFREARGDKDIGVGINMVLDLTDERAVRQALRAFALSRAALKDLPKRPDAPSSEPCDPREQPSRDAWLDRPVKAGWQVRVVGEIPEDTDDAPPTRVQASP